MKNRLDLGQSEFDALLGLFSDNRDEAGAVYERLRQGLLRFYRYRGISDAESLIDETLDRVAARSARFDPSLGVEPKAFVYGFATRIAMEQARKAALTRQLDGLEPLCRDDPPAGPGDAEHNCMRACLDKLSDADRELVIEYYSYEAGGKTELRNAMAERLDCTPATLYVRVCRVRKRLKKCREECCKT